MQHAGIQQIIPGVYGFTLNARGRHSEPLRPEWQDVEPLVAKLDAISETELWRRFWYELPDKHTEACYVRQALEGTWPDEPELWLRIPLVCHPNLDVYRGFAGQYIKCYGNLRRDGVDEVLSRAVADGACSDDELWFPGEQRLSVQELAARFGHPHSQRIHMHPGSIRYWWLECARRAGPMKKQQSLVPSAVPLPAPCHARLEERTAPLR